MNNSPPAPTANMQAPMDAYLQRRSHPGDGAPVGWGGGVGSAAVSHTCLKTITGDGDGEPRDGGKDTCDRSRPAGTGLAGQSCGPHRGDRHPPAPAPDNAASLAGGGLPARSARLRRSGFLNAIETCFGPELERHFDKYLAAIGVTVQMGRSVEDTRHLMRRHLRQNDIDNVHGESLPPWEIVQSPLGGRGVVATRDLRPGDLVLKDAPLVVGPRAGSDRSSCPPVCVGCNRTSTAEELSACPRGCGLPVCRRSGATCGDADVHRQECALLRRWGPLQKPEEGWSWELLRAAAPVRCLALPPDRREILASMQSHHGRQHASEVDLLLRLVRERPSADEERFMRLACCVMDANAFRVAIPCQDELVPVGAWGQRGDQRSAAPSIGVLRGLYPLGALLNHGCTPNTRHSYDARGHMVIRAVRDVCAGEELTVTYSALLWGTPARRQHLLRTKHFLCRCPRCQDPTEGGTCLSALLCPARPCLGPVLPLEPLALAGPWQCSSCGLHVPAERAALLQSVLGGLLRTLYAGHVQPSPSAIQLFLTDNEHLLPPSNHISMELRMEVMWALGHRAGYTFPELSEDQLKQKEHLCRQLLTLLSSLQAGQCSLLGMLQYELHCTLMERVKREPGLLSVVGQEALEAVETAFDIIAEANDAPTDLPDAVRRARMMILSCAVGVQKVVCSSTHDPSAPEDKSQPDILGRRCCTFSHPFRTQTEKSTCQSSSVTATTAPLYI